MCFSSWKLLAVIRITFYAYKLTEHVIRAPVNLPSYINSHPAITTLTVQPNTKSTYNDLLCCCCFLFFVFVFVFQCRACHFKFRRDRLEHLQFAQNYAEDKWIDLKNFKGISLIDLSYFEQRHKLRIHVYSLRLYPQDQSRLPFARLERHPLHVGDSSTTDLYLSLFDNTHFGPKEPAQLVHQLLLGQGYEATGPPVVLAFYGFHLHKTPVKWVEVTAGYGS